MALKFVLDQDAYSERYVRDGCWLAKGAEFVEEVLRWMETLSRMIVEDRRQMDDCQAIIDDASVPAGLKAQEARYRARIAKTVRLMETERHKFARRLGIADRFPLSHS